MSRAADPDFGTRERIDRKQIATVAIAAENDTIGPHGKSTEKVSRGHCADRRGIGRIDDTQMAIRLSQICPSEIQRSIGGERNRIEEMASTAEERRDSGRSVDEVEIALAVAPVIRTADAVKGICSGLHRQIGDVDRNAVGCYRNAADDRAGRRIKTEQVAGSRWSRRWGEAAGRLRGREESARRVKREPEMRATLAGWPMIVIAAVF